ncbi:serine/threonine protein kinase [Corallococcus terminator]|uniref:Serine/threonine protein kinase n=1 Tax=Corallococcus terminator TaxID=2316733 RepID=A0A3A8I212_9BACT|nr:serine/threonine-protein kinase [Corallococcus terminator]RKG73710.1 serine/threonine protein kinase [Corallococcus terminator]
MALQAGDVFGRYELVSWLGRGGMAETWRAQLVGDAGVTKPVLIKKVLPEFANDEAFISMFISEARISATLSHGNVAQVFDFGRVDGEYFLAMEFVDGQPLHRILKRAMKSGLAALPVPVAVFIAMEMCRGLHYAHTRTNGSGKPLGIVHRDISPDNVLVGYEGQVKIVDFGIAKAQLQRGFKTAPGVVKGKYLFFSPEQARGEDVDARTDVWATGVVLYELLCGKMPAEGPPHVVMTKVGRGDIPAPNVHRPGLPRELNDIVMKALTPDRNQRFESSHAFGDALAGFLYSNYPRFSAMTVANLLRVLFRGDLTQEGRELSVPGSFLEEMKSWNEPSVTKESTAPPPAEHRESQRAPAAKPPVTETTEPLAREVPPVSPRRLLLGLGVGGLLTAGACLWLVLDSHAPQPATKLPPSIPFRPPVPATKQAPPPVVANEAVARASPPAEAQASSEKEAKEVGEMMKYIHDASKHAEIEAAVDMANFCKEKYPSNPVCQDLLRLALSKATSSRNSPPPESIGPFLESHGAIIRSIREIQDRVEALTLQGDIEGALFIAHTCANRAPTVSECHLLLGDLYARRGDISMSEKHYQRFLKMANSSHPKRKYVIEILSNASKAPSTSASPK